MNHKEAAPGFVVCSLPRSRSAWLSNFLTYGDWYCGHEQLRYMRSLEDVKAWLAQPNTGSCETGAAPFWRLLKKYAPDTRVAVIRRPVPDVVESLRKVGWHGDQVASNMTAFDRKLDQIEQRLPNVLSVQFEDLEQEDTCRAIFEHCLPHKHDHQWWQSTAAINTQINFPALVRYVTANMPAIHKLAAQAREVMLSDLVVRPVRLESVTISEGALDDLIRDCQPLFRNHAVNVGEAPDNWLNKNIPLMKRLYEMGSMQILIGRSNGRAFGYLMSIIAPSLEAKDRTSAHHSLFYAAPECPGLGLKLQRTALRLLKEKGVHEVFMRAGIRGDGDRMGVLYHRLGAQNFGEMYRLGLGA